jgi:hypothetical protein
MFAFITKGGHSWMSFELSSVIGTCEGIPAPFPCTVQPAFGKALPYNGFRRKRRVCHPRWHSVSKGSRSHDKPSATRSPSLAKAKGGSLTTTLVLDADRLLGIERVSQCLNSHF